MNKILRTSTMGLLACSLVALSACQPSIVNQTVSHTVSTSQPVAAPLFYLKKDMDKIKSLIEQRAKQHPNPAGFSVKDVTSGIVLKDVAVTPSSFNPHTDQPVTVSMTTNTTLIVTMPGVKWHEVVYPNSEDGAPVTASFTWNGHDDDGAEVPNGNYIFKIQQITFTTNGQYNPYCGAFQPFVTYDPDTNTLIPTCVEGGLEQNASVTISTAPVPTPTPQPTATPPVYAPGTVGVETTDVEFDDETFKIIIKGHVVGTGPNFDKNTIKAKFGSPVTIQEQKITAFTPTSPTTADFTLEILKYQVEKPKKDILIDDFKVEAQFTVAKKKQAILLANNSFTNSDFGVAAVGPVSVYVKEDVKCNNEKGVLCNNAVMTDVLRLAQNIEGIYEREQLPNIEPYTVMIEGAYYTVPVEQNITRGMHVAVFGAQPAKKSPFQVLSVDVIRGFVTIGGSFALRGMLLDLGVAAGLVTPVGLVVGAGIVATLTIEQYNALSERAEVVLSSKDLGQNLGPKPGKLADWPAQPHHIVQDTGMYHISLRTKMNNCPEQFPNGVDSAANGLWLTKWAHGTQPGSSNIHTKNYVRYVLDILNRHFNNNGCDGLLSGLNEIRRALEKYDDDIRRLVKNPDTTKQLKPEIKQIKNGTPWEKANLGQ